MCSVDGHLMLTSYIDRSCQLQFENIGCFNRLEIFGAIFKSEQCELTLTLFTIMAPKSLAPLTPPL